jgi:hypothetical protein
MTRGGLGEATQGLEDADGEFEGGRGGGGGGDCVDNRV